MNIYNKKGALLAEVKSKGAVAEHGLVDIDDQSLSFCDLAEGVLEGVIFSLGDFEEACINNSLIRNVKFVGTWMCDVRLMEADVRDTDFYDVQAHGALFSKSTFTGVRFSGANLSLADFSNAVFYDVVFGKDNIGHKTDISGVDFSNVEMKSITFDGAQYDENTKFPSGFAPIAQSGLERK